MTDIIERKRNNSENRLKELKQKLSKEPELENFQDLTMFVTGSYARKEASEFSDIDLFFLLDGKIEKLESPLINSYLLFARVIKIATELRFPAFSNDGQFLEILEYPTMEAELGGRNDDHANYFTARMLMLLESEPVYGADEYEALLRKVVRSYFRDYRHHPKNFKPIFLINDIIRFWKTLCLNYEHKRNQPAGDESKRVKQKVKNFKLKFSRLVTCFGSLVAIMDMGEEVEEEHIINLRHKTPIERILCVARKYSFLETESERMMELYEWFLEQTNVSESDLLENFKDTEFKTKAFDNAEEFGNCVFCIVKHVAEQKSYMRYLLT